MDEYGAYFKGTTIMDNTNFLDILLISIAVAAIVGYLVGQYHERKVWNELIAMGVIPLPPKWVRRWCSSIKDQQPNEFNWPVTPPEGTPLWDATLKKYVQRGPKDLTRNRWLF
jgi:hypothetical protein